MNRRQKRIYLISLLIALAFIIVFALGTGYGRL
jgi:hypothetical protein